MKEYLKADLRERRVRGLTTMVEKLPKFIIRAKNKHEINRKIDRLLMK